MLRARATHDDRDDVVGRGVIDLVHDQTLDLIETRIAVDVGLPGRFALAVLAPYRAVRSDITYLDRDGAEVALVRDGIHHRDEWVRGLVDPTLAVRRSWRAGAWTLGARAGASVPLGPTVEDPFALGAAGLAHQHVQTGTGTWMPVLGVDVARRVGALELGGSVSTQQGVHENARGYQPGDRYALGLRAGWRRGRYTPGLGLDVAGETTERWDGVAPVDDGNQGRLDVLLGAGLEVELAGGLSLEARASVPALTYVKGGELDIPAVVSLAVRWSSAAAVPRRGPDDDEHDHGDGHDHHDHGEHDHGDDGALDAALWEGLDVADLGPAGAAVPLPTVPGKLVVFDLWATWCEPCHELTRALAALARRHPDRLAVRRLEVHDYDDPAAQRYLVPGKFQLPHVKLVRDDQTVVLELSGDPDELIRALEAALAR